jgi:type VI secretion system protein VasD
MTLSMQHKFNKQFILPICLLFIGILASSCAKNPIVSLNIQAVKHLNPDLYQHQKPLLIQVYQLTKPIPFKTASYTQLEQSPAQALPQTLVDYHNYEIRPGEKKQIDISITKDTQYIGVAAGFHRIKKAHWREVHIIPHQYHHLKLRIHAGVDRIDTQLTGHFL